MPKVILTRGEARQEITVRDGTSLHQVMLEQNPESGNFPEPVIALFDGKPVLRAEWEHTVLSGDDVAVFAGLPMGGSKGSNPMALVLTIALTAVAGHVGTMVGGLVGGLVSGAIMAGGSKLIGALFGNMGLSSGHVGASNAEQSSPTYSLNATGNTVRLNQPEPEGFGRMKVVPDIVAKPWSQYINNEMYLYQVFGLGRGEYEHHEMAFDDVVFWKDGKLLSSAFVDEDEAQELPVGRDLPGGAYGSGQPGAWSTPVRVSPAGAVARNISLTVSLPDGVQGYYFQDGHMDYDGDGYSWWVRGDWHPCDLTVGCAAQIREIGPDGTPLENWRHFATGQWTLNTSSAQEFTLSGAAQNEFGLYEVRMRNSLPVRSPITAWESQQYVWSDKILRSINARERLVWKSVSSAGASVQVQLVEAGQAVSLFPDNVETSSSVKSQELLAPNEEGGYIGPFVCCPPGTKTDRILLDIILPQGLGWLDNNGNLRSCAVEWQAECQAIDDNNVPHGAWAALNTGKLELATKTAQRRTLDCPVPLGRWQVRMRRSSDTRGDNRTLDKLYWEAMRAILPGTLTYGQSAVALRIRATNRMSQSAAQKFTVLQTRKLPVWDPAQQQFSVPVPTRSLAAAVAWVCMAPWGGCLKANQIDLNGLWALDEIAQEKGWRLDAWVDGYQNVWSLLLEFCKVARIIPRPAGNILTFAMDAPHRPVRHVFTPHNIVRNSLKPTWAVYSDSSPDDVNVSYKDEDAGFARRDVRATLPDSESPEHRQNGNESQHAPIGIVSRRHAHAYGVHLAACNRYRRIGFEFQTEGMGRLLNVGDIVSIQHPRLRAAAGGSLREWSAASLTVRLACGQDIPALEDGAELYLAFTRPDGTPWGPVRLERLEAIPVEEREEAGEQGDPDDLLAVLDAEDYSRLIMQGHEVPFDWFSSGAGRLPTTWVLETGREFSRRCIVEKITPQSIYRHTINVLNDDPRVYNQNIPVPVWEWRGQQSEAIVYSAPGGLSARPEGAGTALELVISWLPVAGAGAYEVEYSTDGLSWLRMGRANINAMRCAVSPGTAHVRVAAVFGNDIGPWAVWSGTTDILLPAAPQATLVAPYTGALLSVQWAAVPGAQEYILRLYTPEYAAPVRVQRVQGTSWTYGPEAAAADGGPWRALRLELSACNQAGESAPVVLAVEDAAPAAIPLESILIDVDSTENSVKFSISCPVEQDVTGFVIARGSEPEFFEEEVLEARMLPGLPYIWSGLPEGEAWYFRLAAADSFFNVAGAAGSLNWSRSIDIAG